MLQVNNGKRDIEWVLTNHLDDLDYGDDLYLLSHKHYDMLVKLDDLLRPHISLKNNSLNT